MVHEKSSKRAWRWLSVLVILAAAAVVVLLFRAGTLPTQESVQGLVQSAGIWGPLLVVFLMTFAVVASPIPSAPIAVTAGVLYGHWLGTAVVAIGAELGAIIAFGLARILGRDILRSWFGQRLEMGLMGSQNGLMVAIFLSRLMPFLSFDMVSYAAGLTVLKPWRFAVATLAGILPASFVLAHLGDGLKGSSPGSAVWAVLGLGLITGAPIIWATWHRKDEQNDE